MRAKANRLPQRIQRGFAISLVAAAAAQALLATATMAQTGRAVANGDPYSTLLLLGHILLTTALAAAAAIAWAGTRRTNNKKIGDR